MEEILRPKSRVCKATAEEMDSVLEAKQFNDRRAFDILFEAQAHWDNMEQFRLDRERCKNYTYGDQWKDKIKNEDGEEVTEEEYIKSQGNVPLKNNLIRRLVRNVLGVYRSQSKEPTCTARDRDEQKLGNTMSTILQCNWQMNRMTEVNARAMEDFLIGGFVVTRKWFGWQNNRLDCWTTYINPNNFFVDNNMRDFRGWDCNIVGEIHDLEFMEVAAKFAHNAEDYKRLADIYSTAKARNRQFVSKFAEKFGKSKLHSLDFLLPSDINRCRVLEVWRKESKPRYRIRDYNNGDVYKIDIEDYEEMVVKVNARRMAQAKSVGMPEDEVNLLEAEWFIDDYWYYYYLSPFGDILDEGETPYEHGSHPYVFKAYPYIDGEIHSFVSDVIDQQRYTNRLITMYDWIMRSSAKGLLIFPEECLPKGYSIEDIADEWHRYNGVIAIRTKDNPTHAMPQQISANSTNIGINELLNLQLKFFEDISGVNGALQGKPGYASTSGSLYAQQTQNGTTSLLDLLDSFSQFVIDAAYKDVKNMQQFYDTKRVFNIAGKAGDIIVYDPKKVRDVEFDLSIVESTSTPAYRQVANEFLLEIWKSNQISLEQLLQVGDFPFGDELLQALHSQQEQIEQGQTPSPIPQSIMNQVQSGANQEAVGRAQAMITDGRGNAPVPAGQLAGQPIG